MPGGKYYCDYCDKEFRDTPTARKHHRQGILHQRNRRLWFHSLSLHQEPYLIPPAAEPTSLRKSVCNRFVKSGFCPFGDSCKYHHPKHNLQGPIAQGTSMAGVPENLQLQAGGPLQGQDASQSFGMSLGNLPPSLRPPPEGGYPSLPFVDWG